MPTWISNPTGVMHPARERATIRNNSDKEVVVEQMDMDGKVFKQKVPPGGEYTYEGPDRAALFQWWEENGKPSAEQMKDMEGKVSFGENFRNNTEFLKQFGNARQAMGFEKIDEYLKFLGFDEAKALEKFNKRAIPVNVHEMPSRIKEIKRLGGGRNYGADKTVNERYGGFNNPPEV